MEQIGAILDNLNIENPEPGEKQPKPISEAVSKSVSSSLRKSEEETAKLAEIYVLVGEVENSKQVHLSENERASLSMDLFRLGESFELLKRRAEAVKRNLTYGKLSLDVWLSSNNLYTSEEIDRIVSQRIEKRKQDFCKMLQPSELELAKEGLIELQMFAHNERRRMIDKLNERTEKKRRRLHAQFFQLPDQAKIDLWQKAIAKGLVADGDPWAMIILPTLILFMMEEFEDAVKNNSTQPINT